MQHPPAKVNPETTLAEGRYAADIDGEQRIYKVRRSGTSGRLYALRLDPATGTYGYEKGAIFRLAEAGPAPAPEAEQPAKADPEAVLAEGIYIYQDPQHGPYVYKVQRGKKSGKLYAKCLHPDNKFRYAPGAVQRLADLAARPATLEEVAELGRHTGTCACCGQDLTDPESVSAGIGPWCVKKWYGLTRKQYRDLAARRNPAAEAPGNERTAA